MSEEELSVGHIKHELEGNKWSNLAVTFVIAAKEQARAEKGSPLNCFVLDQTISVAEEYEDKKEIDTFFDKVTKNIDSFEDGTRFQLAIRVGKYSSTYRDDDSHWVACDVEVKDKKLSVVMLDPVNYKYTNIALAELKEKYNMTVYNFYDEDYDRIQKDPHSCSRFALDYLFHLSQIPIHDEFRQLQAEGKAVTCKQEFDEEEAEDKGFYSLNAQNCPESLAFIFRDLQSLTEFGALAKQENGKKLHETIINQKGETLEASFRRNIIQDPKPINNAVNTKKINFSQDTLNYIKNLPANELKKIWENRQGYSFLEDKNFRAEVKQHQASRYSPIKAAIYVVGKEFQSLSNQARQDGKNKDSLISDLAILKNLKERLNERSLPPEIAYAVLKSGADKMTNSAIKQKIDSCLAQFPASIKDKIKIEPSLPSSPPAIQPKEQKEQVTARVEHRHHP